MNLCYLSGKRVLIAGLTDPKLLLRLHQGGVFVQGWDHESEFVSIASAEEPSVLVEHIDIDRLRTKSHVEQFDLVIVSGLLERLKNPGAFLSMLPQLTDVIWIKVSISDTEKIYFELKQHMHGAFVGRTKCEISSAWIYQTLNNLGFDAMKAPLKVSEPDEVSHELKAFINYTNDPYNSDPLMTHFFAKKTSHT